MEGEPPWTTPSELAEYTFCPRAHFYRRQGNSPPSPAASSGVAYHQRRLASERWRDEHRSAPWLAVLAGAVLCVLALLVLVL